MIYVVASAKLKFVFFLSPNFSREIKILREHQKKLQASSTRIEEMLKEITTSKENDVKRANIPRALSVS